MMDNTYDPATLVQKMRERAAETQDKIAGNLLSIGATVIAAQAALYDRRVTELLAANNRMLERVREADATNDAAAAALDRILYYLAKMDVQKAKKRKMAKNAPKKTTRRAHRK